MSNEKTTPLQEASQQFCRVWAEDIKDLEENEKKFMDAMHWLLFEFGQAFKEVNDGGDPVTNSYNFPFILEQMQKGIEAYNRLYHIVDTTRHWKNEKDFPLSK